MKFYSGWYYCDDSNWGGSYDSKNLVSINRFPDKDFNNNDYVNLVENKELKDVVIEWLNNNIKDDSYGRKGWCISARKNDDISIWFYRRKDALLFIKEWSYYKKPCYSYNQNTYVSKKLNLKTNTLQNENR